MRIQPPSEIRRARWRRIHTALGRAAHFRATQPEAYQSWIASLGTLRGAIQTPGTFLALEGEEGLEIAVTAAVELLPRRR